MKKITLVVSLFLSVFTYGQSEAENEMYLRSIKLAEQGKYKESMNALDSLLIIDPDNAFYPFMKSRVYLAQGKTMASLDCLSRAQKIDPFVDLRNVLKPRNKQ